MSAHIQDGVYYVADHDPPAPGCKDRGEDCCFLAKHPEPKGILLECGCHPQDAFFEIDGCAQKEPVFVLDSLTVDTTCLCRPLVKIEFSSIVCFEGEAKCGCEKELEVDLSFELVRNCKGEKECVQSWRYVKAFEIKYDDKLKVKISEPFTVTFCDRPCPGCCEYKMTVKVKDLRGDIDALRVVQPNLSALAQGLCDH